MFGVRKATKEFCATLREISDENSHLMAENESLRTENSKMRELMVDIWHDARLLDANGHIDGLRLTEDRKSYYMTKFRELGIEHE